MSYIKRVRARVRALSTVRHNCHNCFHEIRGTIYRSRGKPYDIVCHAIVTARALHTETTVKSGKPYRMRNFSGDPNLCLFAPNYRRERHVATVQ